ncbi:tellurite resistance TerB family protein [Roseomonas frigidaquae]|uniref:Tellurite resistance TerB family protein n=1 Tax=Falsiroseomonas frigidaquae TaxID=487318 RepID=A0ABX1F1E7_9PROT|nr:tellurite resistance TerB family protein [Falsiroseomonas frigidaquae]NKE46175.1 tellurite resistance TerB family protein [Falsiroseomonas frigidaquae]
MIDAKSLLDRFLGSSQGAAPSPWTNPAQGQPPAVSQQGSGGLADMARQALQRAGGGGSGLGGFAGGAAAGGILGLLLGGKGMRRGGGLISHGGAAVLGALAHRAWQNWQAGQAPATAPPATPQDAAAVEPRFLPGATPAAGGEAFELALIRAMIGAARADGHIDAEERARIFAHVDKAGLDAEAKAFVFDALESPIGVSEVAAAAQTQEQASEIYLVSRLAVDPDHPAERAYLEALAHRLKLPAGLVAHLDRQIDAAPAA